MKLWLALGISAALVFFTALADEIEVPHQFSAGTPARSAEVNANFEALTAESNTQHQRLSALESASRIVSAQMFCKGVMFGGQPAVFDCIRNSSPDVLESLAHAEIVAEGWVVTSITGDHSVQVLVLNQYEST